ncbi:hypothetical protein TU55_08935 [Bacillus cereus]|nr:hypothetical protein TU55_08935 [Bacillus cereus]
MRQADLVKIIRKTHKLDISQKVVKERIDKIYKFIKNQAISNNEEFNTNESMLFKKYIKNIERKNFNHYTGAIFYALLLLYQNEKNFRSILKGNIINSVYIEDFITDCEDYINQYLCEIYKSYEEGSFDEYENNGTYFIPILKGFLIKIFDVEKILEERLNNELKNTEILMKRVERFSLYRKNSLIENLNKKLEKLVQKEEWGLKEELRKAIVERDLITITGAVAELRYYYHNEDNYNIVDRRKIFKDLEIILLQSQNYSKLKAMEKFNYFMDIIEKYEDEKVMGIINNLNDLIHKEENMVLSFLEETINLYEQEKEIESNIVKANRDKTKKALFRAGRLKSKTEMKEILELREEYLYIKVNDKQIFESLRELIDIAIDDENQTMLLNIDFILKYYKRFLM